MTPRFRLFSVRATVRPRSCPCHSGCPRASRRRSIRRQGEPSEQCGSGAWRGTRPASGARTAAPCVPCRRASGSRPRHRDAAPFACGRRVQPLHSPARRPPPLRGDLHPPRARQALLRQQASPQRRRTAHRGTQGAEPDECVAWASSIRNIMTHFVANLCHSSMKTRISQQTIKFYS